VAWGLGPAWGWGLPVVLPCLICRRLPPHNCAAAHRNKKHEPGHLPCIQGAPKPKKKNKKTGVPTYLPFLRFFEIFRSDFRKYFNGVFGLLVQRNGQKRDKNNFDGKRRKEKSFFFPQLFRPKVFDNRLSPKSFLWCF
jgi:hypothetical protein